MSYTTQRPNEPVLQQAQGARQITAFIKLTENGFTGPVTKSFEVRNPSARLSGIIEVFWEIDPLAPPEDEESITTFNSTWNLDARAEGITKKSDLLNRVETAQALPRSYEFNSSVRVIRATCTLNPPTSLATPAIDGAWYGRVRWEPNVDMTDKELNILFSRARVEIVQ